MTLRSLRNPRITVTALLNSRVLRTASLTVIVSLVVGHLVHVHAQEKIGLWHSSSSPASARYYRTSQTSGTTLYTADISQIKTVSLESEAVFFGRLERQAKVELVRTRLNQSRDSMSKVRLLLNPVALGGFEETLSPDMNRAVTELDKAERILGSSQVDLIDYHERPEGRRSVILRDQQPAWAFYCLILRRIKAAESGLEVMSGYTSNAQAKVDRSHSRVLEAMEAKSSDGEYRSKMSQALDQIALGQNALETIDSSTTVVIDLLQTTRKDHFPDCRMYGESCESESRRLLEESAPALGLLESAIGYITEIQAAVDQLGQAEETAIRLTEEADDLRYPSHREARALHVTAEISLDNADLKLEQTINLLISNNAGKAVPCPECDRTTIRTRKVLDPTCVCAIAQRPLEEVERLIKDALEMSEQIGKVLSESLPSEDREVAVRRGAILTELRRRQPTGPQGLLSRLSETIQLSREFRNQQFDLYPGESYLPDVAQAPSRSFSPTRASYVGRQTWYYAGYFDDLRLERYGNSLGLIQPIVSYGKFLTDVALLPYNIVVHPPFQAQSTLGYHRPGDYVPPTIYLPPPDIHAAIVEAAVWTFLLVLP